MHVNDIYAKSVALQIIIMPQGHQKIKPGKNYKVSTNYMPLYKRNKLFKYIYFSFMQHKTDVSFIVSGIY